MPHSPLCRIVDITCPDDINRTTATGRRVQPDILRILGQKDTDYTKFPETAQPDYFTYTYAQYVISWMPTPKGHTKIRTSESTWVRLPSVTQQPGEHGTGEES
jgi:hypothetical protein